MKELIIDIIGIIVVLGIIGSISISAISVEAQSVNDLIVNSDFTNGLSGWNVNVTINVNYTWYSNYNGRSGVVVVRNVNSSSRFDLYQVFAVDGNGTYGFTIDFYSNSSCIDCTMYVFLYSPSDSRIIDISTFNIGNITGWYSYQDTVSIPAGSWELYVLIESFDGIYEVGINSVHLYGNDNTETLGGFADNINGYWYLIAYLPIMLSLVFGVAYFIERKLVIRKLLRPK